MAELGCLASRPLQETMSKGKIRGLKTYIFSRTIPFDIVEPPMGLAFM
jgi:hypothetical protein